MAEIALRPYQQKAIDMLYQWFEKNPTGHPVVCLPGGSGKSVVIGSVVRDAVQNWPETRVLMMVGVKELISQNYAKLRELWPNAPAGIYSASLKRRCLTEPITYGGIQSLAKKSKEIGWIDLCIIDECHAISTTETGNYRNLIGELLAINPNMRIIGYTASPYRLGQGMITEGDDAIFTDIIEPVTIEQLIHDGYLCKLQSKHTSLTIDTSGVKKQGGDFVASQLEAAVDTTDNNNRAVSEMVQRGHDCKSWLVFCAGVTHAQHITELLIQQGIDAECLTGQTPSTERDDIVKRFKSGQLRCMVGVGIFTTGFDHPGVDLIAFLRPTMSPGLYLQMAVRGSRPAYAKGMPLDTPKQRWAAMDAGPKPKGCLVLDFAGNVATHGPITAIEPPRKGKKSDGAPRTKTCPQCDEVVSLLTRHCPQCGHEWVVEKQEKPLTLANDDIMGIEPTEMAVTGWQWRKHLSRTSGKEMLQVSYYGGLADPVVTEYMPVLHEGYAGEKARRQVIGIAVKSGANDMSDDLADMAKVMNASKAPSLLKFKRDGKFHRVIERVWV